MTGGKILNSKLLQVNEKNKILINQSKVEKEAKRSA
jgi:hypothetical protein